MSLNLFNTLTRSLQPFTPLDAGGKHVGMYCCGPTVYDFAHIGNWRTFVFGDLVRRYLEFKGYDVRHVMNITDVDDKIIRKVREANTTLPGCALASATNSDSVLAGTVSLTTIISGTETSFEFGEVAHGNPLLGPSSLGPARK